MAGCLQSIGCLIQFVVMMIGVAVLAIIAIVTQQGQLLAGIPSLTLPAANPAFEAPLLSPARAVVNAPLYEGPGHHLAANSFATAGQTLELTGELEQGGWYRLQNGHWIESDHVANAPTNLIVIEITVPYDVHQPVIVEPHPPIYEAPIPAPEPIPALLDIAYVIDVFIITNYGTQEIIGIQNIGPEPIDISGSQLSGSKGHETCIVPGGTVLYPGEVFHVATGHSYPPLPGYKCADQNIWSNGGEFIFYHWNGQILQIDALRVENHF